VGKTISIHSFRGGTGKSNCAANLAALMARTGLRVGVLDTDIQSPGIHVLFNVDVGAIQYCLNDYLWGRCAIEQAATDVTASALLPGEDPATIGRVFLVPSSIKTGEIARILREGYDVAKLNDGIHEMMSSLNLDILLVDTHPGVNEETLLSIAISDLLVLILRPDNQDFQGTAVTLELARKLDVKDLLLLLNKVPAGLDQRVLRTQVEATFEAPVAAMLPLNTEIAQNASGGIFCLRHPEHPFSRRIEEVSRKILERE
jgi:MinD-like ATPase involved in chromosome partitioning or flagellar assembly